MKGYLGAAVFSSEGKILGGVTDVSGINFEISGNLFHNILLIVKNICCEAGFGNTDILQVYTDLGIILGKYCSSEKTKFNIILVIQKSADIKEAKLLLDKVKEDLKQVI